MKHLRTTGCQRTSLSLITTSSSTPTGVDNYQWYEKRSCSVTRVGYEVVFNKLSSLVHSSIIYTSHSLGLVAIITLPEGGAPQGGTALFHESQH